MNQENKKYVSADKTSNYYKVAKDDYEEMILKNVTKDYKKTNDKFVDKVNEKDRDIAEKLELEDRIYSYSKRDAYITIKDHKENFRNNTKCRLINPAKSELGKISKKILSKIVTSLREMSLSNQWKNSFSVIEWFKNLENKKELTFLEFDIVEFYPSITEDLLKRAINYAKDHVEITKEEINIILQTKKALLFHGNNAWTKKGNKSFDVTMGSWDGAEVADLVGLYLLSQLSDLPINVGLYRDDGLAVCNLSGRQAELTKKKLCKIFKDNGLNITAEANKKDVNFLDINLNLDTGIYRPYMKPNNTPVYVNRHSNHPRGILENIPRSVNRRLSALSANKEVFDLASPPYQDALNKSGYDFTLYFDPPVNSQRSNNRQRNITYFNPPFSKNVKTNVGKIFLNLIEKNFPHGHPLRQIVNRNTVKISDRCPPCQ